MLYIVWRGYGWLIALFFISTLVISMNLPTDFKFAEPIISLVVTAAIWFLGVHLNREPHGKMQKENGKIVSIHTFFWIPMQYWAAFFAFGILGQLYTLFVK